MNAQSFINNLMYEVKEEDEVVYYRLNGLNYKEEYDDLIVEYYFNNPTTNPLDYGYTIQYKNDNSIEYHDDCEVLDRKEFVERFGELRWMLMILLTNYNVTLVL